MKKTGGLVAHTSNDNIGILLQGPTFVMLITACKSLLGFFLIVAVRGPTSLKQFEIS